MDPLTREEQYLAYIAGEADTYPEKPVTRIEKYLDAIAKNGGGGGGGGDVTGVKGSAENKYRKGNVSISPDNLGLANIKEIGDGLSLDPNGELSATGGGGGSAELTEDLSVTSTVGVVVAGTTYEEGTALEDIFKDMLNPVEYPSFVAPSVSLSATGAKLLEKGASLATTMTAAFSRGSITPAYGTSGYRSGEATGYALNGGSSQAGNTFNVTITEAQKTYKAAVSYAAGEQPKDSIGHDYDAPLPAGSVESNTISYEFVEAMWANTAAIATIAKLSLVSKSAKQRDMTFPAQTVANPEVFDVPASWTVTAVQVKNDLSGAYEDALDQFTVTNVTHDDAGGSSVAYKRYTFNLGYGTGVRTVRVKWN